VRYLALHGFTGGPESLAALPLPSGSVTPVLGGHQSHPVLGDFESEVERLAALGAGCDGLLGYSLGGRLALGILAREPQRFRHALIISAHPGLAGDDERAARRQGDLGFVDVLRERGLPAFVDVWQALPLWASQGGLPEAAKQAQREQRLRHEAEGLAQSLIHHGLGEMPNLRPLLKNVRTRVDLLVGERDVKFVTLARELSEIIPDARLTIAPDAGHNLLLERPALCAGLLERGAEA
jgi:2-succinyl-6-hydroxy-2,4-cyclohexadiene-1-carboxylate synthase